ncbi:18796_t:CDS:1, partial [Funneliformis geosporum]
IQDIKIQNIGCSGCQNSEFEKLEFGKMSTQEIGFREIGIQKVRCFGKMSSSGN